ncbi:MAG: hypothetical protein QM759_08340 [Terricaulis sp.]
MSFREKIAWASLLGHLIVFGVYFALCASGWVAPSVGAGQVLVQMGGAVIALIVISIVLAITAVVSAPKDVKPHYDEREKLIRLRAANVASAIVIAGVILVMNALLFGWNAVLAANLLLAVLVISEIVKAIAQIVQFRTNI